MIQRYVQCVFFYNYFNLQPFKDSSEFTIGYMDSFVDHAWGPDGRIFCVFMDQDPATLNKLVLLVKDLLVNLYRHCLQFSVLTYKFGQRRLHGRHNLTTNM